VFTVVATGLWPVERGAALAEGPRDRGGGQFILVACRCRLIENGCGAGGNQCDRATNRRCRRDCIALLSRRTHPPEHPIDACSGGRFPRSLAGRSAWTAGAKPWLTMRFFSGNRKLGRRERRSRARAVPFIFATFKLFENAWVQQRQGTLDPQQWEGWDAYIRIYYHRPGVNR
jgi:hypothetical protein